MSNPDHLLVILPHPQELHLRGKIQIKSLVGCVEILGYRIKPTDQYFPCFSPEGNSCLCLKTVPMVEDFNQKQSRKYIKSLLQEEDADVLKEIISLASNKNNVTLLIKRLNLKQYDFVTSVSPYQQIFSVPQDEDLPHSTKWLHQIGVQICNEDRHIPKFHVPREYEQIAVEFCDAIKKGMYFDIHVHAVYHYYIHPSTLLFV